MVKKSFLFVILFSLIFTLIAGAEIDIKTPDKKSSSKSLVSLKEAEIVKSLQENKAVFLCFHKEKEASFKGIKTDLEAINSNFKGAVKIVYVANDDKQEELRNKFKMPAGKTAVFVVAPSGQAVAKLEGANITKENLMKALLTPRSGGCCPSPSGSNECE